MTSQPDTAKFSIRNYAAIIAILLVLIMTVLDVTVVNVALPVLATKFSVSDSMTVWIVTVYQLVITMLLLPVSSIGDLHSYRRTFLTGVVIFTASSALCDASISFNMIVISRAIQGLGAACVMGVNIALTRLIYPRNVLGRGLALNAMVIAIATAAGPTIAGAILSVTSWHWLFLINIPFGIIAFIIGFKLLPHNPPKTHKTKFDTVSALENMIVFGLIFYSLGSFSRKGDLVTNLCLLCGGLIVGVFYIRHQRHRESPMLPIDLFHIKLYTLSIITAICSFIAQMLAMVSLPFLLLNNYGFSAITTGLLMTPCPLTTMIISPLAARYVERHNPGTTAAVGMAFYALGVLLLLFAPGSDHISEWDIAWRMAICGLGFGLFQTPNNIVMVMATPIERTGSAGGMQSTARLIGQTMGATLVILIFSITNGGAWNSVHVCLVAATVFAAIAGIFSLTRSSGIKQREEKIGKPLS